MSFGVRFDQVEFEITDRYFADGRDDSGSKQFDDTSPMVGLVVELTDDLNFYTTYSSAFETPTTTEFNRQDGLGGFNEALEPQTATNFEVGLRGALGDAQRYEVAVFTIDVEDELVGREIPTSPGRNYFENAGETSREGVEFSWTANFTDRIETTVSYTYSDFKFSQFVETVGAVSIDRSGNVIPGTAENLLFGEFAYRAPRGWFAAAEVLYVDEQFGDNANNVVIDDYTLTSFRFGYDAELGSAGGFSLSPFVGINNVTDETYTANVRLNAAAARYFEPGPGRNALRRRHARLEVPLDDARGRAARAAAAAPRDAATGVYYDRLSRWTALLASVGYGGGREHADGASRIGRPARRRPPHVHAPARRPGVAPALTAPGQRARCRLRPRRDDARPRDTRHRHVHGAHGERATGRRRRACHREGGLEPPHCSPHRELRRSTRRPFRRRDCDRVAGPLVAAGRDSRRPDRAAGAGRAARDRRRHAGACRPR